MKRPLPDRDDIFEHDSSIRHENDMKKKTG